ncbi:hypothetical protein [Clostridium minihomine]|uniref:hypothetical protein n=1 Tax=Clostridium minihomine TaxID=2045012 RepID=UPI000C7740E3|nr:hypothetical protein [Clostridium minihomine]
MIIRQLSAEQYESLKKRLIQTGQSTPLLASYDVTMKVDGFEYLLKLQPCSKRKIAALQAVRIQRFEKEQKQELITENLLLSCLLELFVFQAETEQQRLA